ncbi:hypothetical protein FACS18949_04380 [Clostridia bacterium]|nr:hypothetical protein FACS18949_04380 [Clostridia bacterium]
MKAVRNRRKSFIRQKTIDCADQYREVDIYNLSADSQEAVKGKRATKTKITAPKQQDLNDRRAQNYFRQVAMANFFEGDLAIHATYDSDHLPATEEEAVNIRRNFIRRIAYQCKKQDLPEPKVLNVEEISDSGRIHHHILLSCQLSRDAIEDMWRETRKKGQKQGDSLGHINADRIQGDVLKMAEYISKSFFTNDSDPPEADEQPAATVEPTSKCGRHKNKRRWSGSQNLTRPTERTNDNAFSSREVERLAKQRPPREYWEQRYEGWTLYDNDSVVYRHNEQTGWSVSLRLRRKAPRR